MGYLGLGKGDVGSVLASAVEASTSICYRLPNFTFAGTFRHTILSRSFPFPSTTVIVTVTVPSSPSPSPFSDSTLSPCHRLLHFQPSTSSQLKNNNNKNNLRKLLNYPNYKTSLLSRLEVCSLPCVYTHNNSKAATMRLRLILASPSTSTSAVLLGSD